LELWRAKLKEEELILALIDRSLFVPSMYHWKKLEFSGYTCIPESHLPWAMSKLALPFESLENAGIAIAQALEHP